MISILLKNIKNIMESFNGYLWEHSDDFTLKHSSTIPSSVDRARGVLSIVSYFRMVEHASENKYFVMEKL